MAASDVSQASVKWDQWKPGEELRKGNVTLQIQTQYFNCHTHLAYYIKCDSVIVLFAFSKSTVGLQR